MTIEKKRDLIARFCLKTRCSTCPLRNSELWIKSARSGCINIIDSPESDLDKALKIIEDYDSKGRRGIGEDVKIIGEKIETDTHDPVNHPSHYTSGGIECIDAMEASMSPLEYMGYLKGAIIKYVWRYRLKGKPVEDLKKARFYLDKLISAVEKEVSNDD